MKSNTHNQKADSGAIFRRLLRFMGPYRKGLTISVICIILSSLFNSFGPFVLGRATDALAGLVTGGEPVYRSPLLAGPDFLRRFGRRPYHGPAV